MNCSQDTVSRILERGRKSAFGLEAPERPIRMANYSPESTQTLAMALVGGYHEKYDLIAVLWAAMDEAYEQGLKANEKAEALSLSEVDPPAAG
jgi:hypothetical protein